MRTFIISSIFVLFSIFASAKALKLKTGAWHGELYLTQNDTLPFDLEISKNTNAYSFLIKNGEEHIKLSDYRISGDTLIIDFPDFHSSIFLIRYTKKSARGFWRNYNKSGNYEIPIQLSYGEKPRFSQMQSGNNYDFSGNWKTIFNPSCQHPDFGIGIFANEKNDLSGTFRTETGDYRFLAGNRSGNSFRLSCFDGAHAFLFKAEIRNDSLIGTFNSGSHYKTDWIAIKDEKFQLRNPDSLTYIVKPELSFTVKDMNGNAYSFPEMGPKNKVIIVQILGSWCPNCMDEVRYFQGLYSKYHDQGLEIISVAYEMGESFEDQKEKIDLLLSRYDLPFTFLIGGAPDKKLVSQQFADLNEIISFPTTIFLNRDGQVVRIHTGFNGPGTGEHYSKYVEETNLLIEAMLKD